MGWFYVKGRFPVVNVRFDCPQCGVTGRLTLPAPAEWSCRACNTPLHLHAEALEGGLRACAICGNHELYRKKDFPQRLGLAILALACLASVEPYRRYMIWLVWTILLGSLAFDYLLYRLVGDVVVCYRCLAQYRGVPANANFAPYELGIAERYRQEKIRLEQMAGTKKQDSQ
jgi:hypothetical protein